jgi:glycosyltransferase involved in cell wall biosynthesis
VKKRPVRIALLATVVEFGGSEKVILSLLENINTELFDVVPIIYTRSDQTNNRFISRLEQMKKKYYFISVNKYKFKYLNPIINIVETYNILKKNQFDLLHTHGYRADVLGSITGKITGLSLISTCHGFIANDSNLTLYNMIDRIILRSFNKIIAVSKGIKDDLIKSGIHESHITVLQNAVSGHHSSELFSQNRQSKRKLVKIDGKDFVIGYLGRLSEEKGINYLIEAGSLLFNEGMPIRLLIIGEGPQRKEMEDLVKKTNIGDNITFVGFQSEIEEWLPAIDVFVLPSLTEGTPMALLEAMAYGIPVVASTVGGIPYIIDSGKNGILVSPGNPQDIKDAISLLYRNEDLRNTFSREAQNKIKSNYNVEDWTRKMEAEYLNMKMPNDKNQNWKEVGTRDSS